MTSSVKIGLISLCVVGAGLGAYLVKHSLKNDRNVKKSTDSSVAMVSPAGTGSVSGTESPNAGSPTGTASGSLAMTDTSSGHAASPPPLGPSANGGDSDRSFRPHTPEATAAPFTVPSAPGGGQGNTTGSEAPAPAVTSPAPASSGAGSAATTPATPTYTPPVPTPTQTPAPTQSNSDRMGLRDVTPSGSSAGTTGTSTAKTAAPAPSIPAKTTYHVVQAGDTLSSIAAKYLGSSKYASLIAKANPSVRPNRLMVGAKLKIPTAPTTQPAGAGGTAVAGAGNAQKPKTVLPPVDPSRAYTVKAGDNWPNLAKKFLGNENWTMLYEYNKDRFPRNSWALHPGMVLEIPPKEAPPAKSSATPSKEGPAPKDSSTPKK